MNLLYSFLLLANIVIVAAIGIFALVKNRKDIFHQGLASLCLITPIWMCTHFARYSVFSPVLSATKEQAFVWAKLSYIAGAYVIVFCLLFTIIFPDRRNRPLPKLFALGYCGLLPVILLVLTMRNLVVKDMHLIGNKYFIVAGSGMIAYAIFSVGSLLASLIVVLRKMRRLAGLQRLQLKYAAMGIILANVFIYFVNLVFPAATIFFPRLLQYGIVHKFTPFFTLFFVYFAAYATFKHRLLDIEILISRSVGYVAATSLVIGVYTLLVVSAQRFLQQIMGQSSALITSSSALLIAMLFHPLRMFIQDKVYGRFFAQRFAYQKLLLEASGSIVTIMNLEELINYFIDMVQKYIGMERVAFLMRRDEEEPEGGHVYYIHAFRGVPEEVANKFEVRNGLISWFCEQRKVFVRDEIEYEMSDKGFSKLYSHMHQLGAEIMVPVFTRNSLAGILSVDRKRNGRTYSQQDIDILNILAAHVGVAIDNARLYGEAINDQLTGIFSRRYFEYRLNEEIVRAQRFHRPLSLLKLDIDYFKHINDTCGHSAGDFVLKQIARVIRAGVRQIDMVSRYSGEEIAIILPETGEKATIAVDGQMQIVDACRAVAERIHRQIEQHEFWFGQQKIPVTVSIGMACYADVAAQKVTMAEIVGTADRALYEAKQAGRNCVKGFS